MAIDRTQNLNVRDVPGNGSIVGPSTAPYCFESFTTCCSCTNHCDACTASFTLGNTTYVCSCPCCDCCFTCTCTVCNKVEPSAMWKVSEQNTARNLDAWGDNTSSNDASTFAGTTNVGTTAANNVNAYGNVLCAAAGVGWIIAPNPSEVSRTWYARNDAVSRAQQQAGGPGWFLPDMGQFGAAQTCRQYWQYSSIRYWTNNNRDGNHGCYYQFSGNHFGGGHWPMSNIGCVRAFRCVTY